MSESGTRYLQYTINSERKQLGTHSNFLYNIPPGYITGKSFVCVSQASIPKSFYLVTETSKSNQFTLVEGASSHTIIVPVGSYTRKGLAKKLANLLTGAGAWTYTVTFSSDPDNGLYVFTVTGNSSQPSFILTSGAGINKNMGFNSGTKAFSGDQLTSENVIDLQRETTLFLRSSLVAGLFAEDNILQPIFAGGDSSFSRIVFQQHDREANAKVISTSGNNYHQFSLTDEDGNEVNLNGNAIVFTLWFW